MLGRLAARLTKRWIPYAFIVVDYSDIFRNSPCSEVLAPMRVHVFIFLFIQCRIIWFAFENTRHIHVRRCLHASGPSSMVINNQNQISGTEIVRYRVFN